MRKVVFLTGTRADFGKIKTLIRSLQDHPAFETGIFVTGMHLLEEYGYTVLEVERSGFDNIHRFSNHTSESTMDLTLAKTVTGFSAYVKEVQPDLIVVHGDRVEALAGSIVGSLNNILVAHVEGGEISGTVDELIRHSVSKLSHVHYVANERAKKRLVQMGEVEQSIQVIGSPDLDVMFSDDLPSLSEAKDYYNLVFENYAVAMFHPVTTEVEGFSEQARMFVDALLASEDNYLVVYPNNDLGSRMIIDEYQRFADNNRFRVLPSLRFEFFLVLLKHADYIIGNSSAGIREAPYYQVPTVNVGSRQANRAEASCIINAGPETGEISSAILEAKSLKIDIEEVDFGRGNSAELFLTHLLDGDAWAISKQKQFRDL